MRLLRLGGRWDAGLLALVVLGCEAPRLLSHPMDTCGPCSLCPARPPHPPPDPVCRAVGIGSLSQAHSRDAGRGLRVYPLRRASLAWVGCEDSSGTPGKDQAHLRTGPCCAPSKLPSHLTAKSTHPSLLRFPSLKVLPAPTNPTMRGQDFDSGPHRGVTCPSCLPPSKALPPPSSTPCEREDFVT